MLSSIITGLISSLLIISMSFFFGRYIQNKFKILVNNQYLSFGIGFLVYIAIINATFMPIMFFSLSGTMLLSVWWIVNILLVVFMALKWKMIDIKNIDRKQLYIFLVGGIIITIASIYIGVLPKSGDQLLYVPWVKHNQYTDHLNSMLGNNNKDTQYMYQGQGWYYFQTVLLRTTQMDQNFMNLWVFGSFLGFLMSSIMFGFVYTIIKKSSALLMAAAATVAIATQTFVNLGDYSNMGIMVIVWIVILLFILAINAIQLEKLNLFILFSIISFAGWATISSALFIIGMLYIAILFALLFRKSSLLFPFLLVNAISLLAMIWILTFKFHTVIFILSSIALPCLIILSIWLLIWKRNILDKLSIIISAYKYWIFGLTLMIIFSLSIYFWVINGMDSWLNFSYKQNGLKTYIDNELLSISRYIIYWCFTIYLVWRFIVNLKSGVINKPFDLFHFIVAFVVILFFNPLVASLWDQKIVPNQVYYRVIFIALVPLYVSVIIFVAKFRLLPKHFKNVIYTSFVIGMGSSILIPFVVRPFMRANYSSYTGYSRGLPEVGEYINSHNLGDKKIAGDVDGIFAYVNNPLSFPRHSKEFDAFSYSILTNKFYGNIGKTRQDEIQILIKINDNIAHDWNPFKYNFNKSIILSNYEIFIK